MIRRIMGPPSAAGAVAGPGGTRIVIGPGGVPLTVVSAPAGGAMPGTGGVHLSAGSTGSITTAGGPNVSIVGSDEAVAISNRTSAMIDIAQVQGQVHAEAVQKVGELADKNPNETVAIIRSWLHEYAA
jgi:flagellar M-ring protein FliF